MLAKIIEICYNYNSLPNCLTEGRHMKVVNNQYYVNTELDCLFDPIMICDGSGKVVYKNTEAQKQLKQPRKGSSIIRLIDSSSLEEYEKVRNGSHCAFVNLNISTACKRALVCFYMWEGTRHTLWIFSEYLQIDPNGKLTVKIEEQLKKLSKMITGKISLLDNNTDISKSHYESDMYSRMRNAIKKYLSVFLKDDNNEHLGCIRSVKRAETLLIWMSEDILAKHGYMLEIKTELDDSNALYITEFNSFMAVFIYVVMFVLEISNEKKAVLSIYEDRGKLAFVLYGKLMHFPVPEVQNGIVWAEKYFPRRRIDFYMTEELYKRFGWKIQYEPDIFNKNGFIVRTQINAVEDRRLKVRSKDDDLNSVIREFLSSISNK